MTRGNKADDEHKWSQQKEHHWQTQIVTSEYIGTNLKKKGTTAVAAWQQPKKGPELAFEPWVIARPNMGPQLQHRYDTMALAVALPCLMNVAS